MCALKEVHAKVPRGSVPIHSYRAAGTYLPLFAALVYLRHAAKMIMFLKRRTTVCTGLIYGTSGGGEDQ
jgi:hypothetical protein